MTPLAGSGCSQFPPALLAADSQMPVIGARREDPATLDEILHGHPKDIAAHGELSDQIVSRALQDRIPGDGGEDATLGEKETERRAGVGQGCNVHAPKNDIAHRRVMVKGVNWG